MEYKEDNCTVKMEGNIVSFSGRIETNDYTHFSEYLVKVDKEIKDEFIIYDLKSLSFLNSSGIKAIAVHLLKSSKKYKIRINAELTWQKVGIVPLRLIKPKGEILIE